MRPQAIYLSAREAPYLAAHTFIYYTIFATVNCRAPAYTPGAQKTLRAAYFFLKIFLSHFITGGNFKRNFCFLTAGYRDCKISKKDTALRWSAV